MTLGDSDFFIDLSNPRSRHHARALETAERAESEGTPMRLGAVTRFELMRGIGMYHDPQAEARRIQQVVRRFATLPLSAEMADRAGTVQSSLERAGQALGLGDALIAGTALEARLPLVTRNVADFIRVPGLDVVRY